jgi:omega-6 fatty acid desaturase (delta-12 desaturase)
VPQTRRLKELRRQVIERHVRPDNLKGLTAVLSTLLPLLALVVAAVWTTPLSWLLTAALVLPASLFLLRAFILMHECGHGSLFRSGALNRGFGFVLGVLCGMPQYVWSQHHQFHHANNGNWDRYRGPLSIVPGAEYAAMSAPQQRRYRRSRSLWLAPFAGFLYMLLNPRLSWLKGSWALLRHRLRGRDAQSFSTPHWASAQEYRHMSWNNAALFVLWAAMAWATGPMLFVVFYGVSASLAGGAGLVLFAVQHNFEHSYASGDEGWDYHRGAIEGTSFLHLPAWLNWFTASIGYHHVHHLSARIPSYCLADCHDENTALFVDVKRVRLAQVPAQLKCILWDKPTQRIVSVAEFARLSAQRAA